MYEDRTYRRSVKAGGLFPFTVVVKETDLFILADRDLAELAASVVIKHRHRLETYIGMHPDFLTSIVPLNAVTGAPEVVRRMADAARAAGVGPMAAVAGTFSELVGEALLKESSEVIVENGGDIFISTKTERVAGIYAGDSPLSGRVGVRIRPEDSPIGVCTSSGRVGHSLSLGLAHAACVLSPSTALADAAATAVGNLVKGPDDIERALSFAMDIPGVTGVVVIEAGRIGAMGKVELTSV